MENQKDKAALEAAASRVCDQLGAGKPIPARMTMEERNELWARQRQQDSKDD